MTHGWEAQERQPQVEVQVFELWMGSKVGHLAQEVIVQLSRELEQLQRVYE